MNQVRSMDCYSKACKIFTWLLLVVSIATCGCAATKMDPLYFLAAGEATASEVSFPDSELQALWTFYNATNGNCWAWKGKGAHWNFVDGENPCTNDWVGINCTTIGSDFHVDSLVLPNCNLAGTVPASIEDLPYLTSLVLSGNYINGTIPSTIGNLAFAQEIDLGLNQLSGEIPASIGSLATLKVFDVQSNHLNGTLPIELFSLQQLEVLNVFDCFFTGAIPQAIGNFGAAIILNFGYNLLTGSLPSALGQLINLEMLVLSSNYFTGTIPDAIGDLAALQFLFLSLNTFSGIIPASIGSLQSLRVFAAFSCSLTGSLPTSFAQLSNLTTLVLTHNKLTGAPPDWIGGLSDLRALVLSRNRFQGTLPSSWGSLAHLSVLQVGTNNVVGSVPDSYSALSNLVQCRLGGNSLGGSVPTALLMLPLLQRLDLSRNRFHGSLPDQLRQSTSLVELILSGNELTGTVPAFLGQLRRLQNLQLDNNALSGTIPSSLAGLRNLTQLTLNNNALRGTLDEVFDPTVQTALEVVILNQNVLSGSLPEIVLKLPALTNLAVGSNCFTGPFPANICSSATLNSLSLDGFQSSPQCNHPLLQLPHWVIRAYTVHKFVGGTFPECLFTMASLTSLHLSSNGVGGTLPENVTISPSLTYLSLSHNLLVGTIPAAFQEKQWYELDLSYNRLRGSLLPTFAKQPIEIVSFLGDSEGLSSWIPPVTAKDPLLFAVFGATVNSALIALRTLEQDGVLVAVKSQKPSLKLNNNRLSGVIPGVIQSMAHPSVLQGNMFDCKYDKSDLPKHDHTHRNRYSCGSSSFNIQYYVWATMVAVCVAVLLLVWRYRSTIERYIGIDYICTYLTLWLNVFTGAVKYPQHAGMYKLDHVYSTDRLMNIVGYITLSCLSFIMLVLAPMYLILAQNYSTYDQKYAWTVSAAFLSGITPVVVQLLVLAVTLLVMLRAVSSLNRFVSTIPEVPIERLISRNVLALDAALLWRTKAAVYTAFFTLNTVVVMGANIGFVYVAEHSTSAELSFAQVWLSLFKVMWNNILATKLLAKVHDTVANVLENPEEFSETKYVTVQVYVALLNNIVIPCIVVAVQSSSCFLNLFESSPQTKAWYVTFYCQLYDSAAQACLLSEPIFQQTHYTSPFTYSYQCSSSLLTSYTPAFVNMCLITTFLIPAMYVLGQQWHRRAAPGTWWHWFLHRAVPPLIRMDELEEEDDARLTRLFSLQLHGEESNQLARPNEKLSVTYFNVNRLVINLVTQLAIMLTFGALFPPLAVAVGFSIASTIYVEKLKVGRFLTAMILKEKFKYVHLVELECQELGSVSLLLRKSVWLLMMVKCCFYALVMFDTLGDKEGIGRAFWVLIVLPAMPPMLYCSHRAYRWLLPRPGGDSAAYSDSSGHTQAAVDASGQQQTAVGAVSSVGSSSAHRGTQRDSTTARHSILSIQANRKLLLGAVQPAGAIELQDIGGEDSTINALHSV